jgi:type IX secretion system PorP/SprF family membrane protein
MKKILLLSAVLLSCKLFAQQEVMVSQYMFNGLFLNPAYAGSHPYFEATGLHRSQWVKLQGAPTTQVFGIDGPFFGEKMGIGATIINDKIGDTRQTEFNANYSYKLLLNEKGTKLAFGLKAGLSNYTAKLSQTKVWDTSDPVFSNDQSNELIPKFGAGIYLYSKLWYFGVSVPTIYAADKKISFNIADYNEKYFENHYFLNAGYVFSAGPNLKIKPNVLFKYHPSAPFEADINTNFLIKEFLWIGASWRSGDSFTGLFEYNITPQLRIGYAYDFTTTDISNYSTGSHEVMLGYNFVKDIIKTKTPRYF